MRYKKITDKSKKGRDKGFFIFLFPLFCSAFLLFFSSVRADSVCGNGIIESPPEVCDDGNTANGDGCSSICAVQSGWTCNGEPSVCGEDHICYGNCSSGNPPLSSVFSYDVLCGAGPATDFPNNTEPHCVKPCWACVDEERLTLNFLSSDVCGSGDAVDYPIVYAPTSCADKECFTDCDNGAEMEEFPFDTVCGEGIATLYPEKAMPLCLDVLCYKGCDNGLEYLVFPYGQECGAGDALDYPHSERPFCATYYQYACNSYYFSLCTSEQSCEALGEDYLWSSSGCVFQPDGVVVSETEIDALNRIGQQNAEIQSRIIEGNRVQSVFLPLIAYLFFGVVFLLLCYFIYKKIYKR